MSTTLPTDSQIRKTFPLATGLLAYFPAALAAVANTSYRGNQKHNPGQPLHHARGKSVDHADCIVRHLVDAQGLLGALERGDTKSDDEDYREEIIAGLLDEVSSLAWRALALSQELHERYGGAPMAPGAK